jgi:serine protease
MLIALAAARLVASMVVDADLPEQSLAGDPRAATFAFFDGERTLHIVRGTMRGHDDSPVAAWLIDPSTGQRAPAMLGHTVIVRFDGGHGVLEDDVRIVRELMPSASMLLVESARGEDAAELAARLSSSTRGGTSSIAWAYPNIGLRRRLHAAPIEAFNPDDPRYPSQFYLDEIDIEDAWALSTGSPDIDVLVADNGCDLAHPDLIDKLDVGVDPIDDDGDPSFEPGISNEHGTACAGIIGASTNNGTDIAGTCPQCRLRCARLLAADDEPVTVASDVLTFEFALEVDADIVSNSWGFVDAIPVPAPLKAAIDDVQLNGRGGKGTVVVFASGNDRRIIGPEELLAIDGIIGVGAVNNLGELTQFSNGGASVDVVAPTGTITTDISGADGADPSDVTVSFGGTSSACPVVAGVVGLMLAKNPELTVDEVNEALVKTARQSIFATPDDGGHDDYYGFGLVQPAKALTYFDEAPPPGDEPTPGCVCTSSVSAWSFADGTAVAGVVLVTFALRPRRARSRGEKRS